MVNSAASIRKCIICGRLGAALDMLCKLCGRSYDRIGGSMSDVICWAVTRARYFDRRKRPI